MSEVKITHPIGGIQAAIASTVTTRKANTQKCWIIIFKRHGAACTCQPRKQMKHETSTTLISQPACVSRKNRKMVSVQMESTPLAVRVERQSGSASSGRRQIRHQTTSV